MKISPVWTSNVRTISDLMPSFLFDFVRHINIPERLLNL